MQRSFLVISLLLLGLSTCSGCGESNPLGRQAVRGSITLNGDPLEEGEIMFMPTGEKTVMTGAPIKAGVYQIETAKGLTPGEYLVRISSPDRTAPQVHRMPGGPPEPYKNLIPPEYSSRSDKKVVVTREGTNQFDFEIKTKR